MKYNFDKSGKVHFHQSDERFCGSTKSARLISFDENQVTCGKCKAKDCLTITAQGLETLRSFGYQV